LGGLAVEVDMTKVSLVVTEEGLNPVSQEQWRELGLPVGAVVTVDVGAEEQAEKGQPPESPTLWDLRGILRDVVQGPITDEDIRAAAEEGSTRRWLRSFGETEVKS
jgi:hypothetical protein